MFSKSRWNITGDTGPESRPRLGQLFTNGIDCSLLNFLIGVPQSTPAAWEAAAYTWEHQASLLKLKYAIKLQNSQLARLPGAFQPNDRYVVVTTVFLDRGGSEAFPGRQWHILASDLM